MAFLFRWILWGNKQSQPSPPILEPWRNIGKKGQAATWDVEAETALRDECVKDPGEFGGKQVRILMMGASGSGKSSFINSVYAALTDKVKDYTFVARSSDNSSTKIIVNPHLRVDKKEPYFRILDSPGLVEIEDDDFFKQFVDHALKGRLKERLEYRQHQMVSEGDHFVEKPGKLDSPCLVVFVVKPGDMQVGTIKKKLDMVKDLAGRDEIKVNVVVTMADTASQAEQYSLKDKDAKYIFNSKCISERVNQISSWTGLPQNRIFPVTNYTEQTETCTEMNIVLLYTLSKLLDNAKLEAERRLLAERGQE